ncbi:MAG TPA: C39 family peptidase [Paucimonas sp.]|nr:C39 family peptidase [Paucimonas sp.]
MKRILRRAILGASLLLSMSAAFAGKQLSVPTIIQEHSNWCWAGSSKAVLHFYAKYPSQCQIVNWAYGINYACGNTDFYWNSTANTPNAMYGTNGSLQSILNAWGVSNSAYGYASSWSSVVWDINNNRPFVIRYGWTSGGGHFIVGDGWETWNGTNYIYTMNPWPGEGQGYRTYASAVSAPDHKWTHTLRMNR